MSPTFAIATAGLAISAGLAALKIWETFIARSRFHVMADWYDASDYELELQFTVANIGYRPDSVRSIAFVNEGAEALRNAQIAESLPMLLKPGAVSPLFKVGVRTDIANDPGTSLFVGKGRIRLVDARGRIHDFPVRNPYDGEGIYGEEDDLPPPHQEFLPTQP